MARVIVKLAGKYIEWSTVADAPCCGLMSREDIAEFVGGDDIEDRLYRTDRHGTSLRDGTSAEDFVRGNRAGPDESCLSIDELIAQYGGSTPFTFRRHSNEPEGQGTMTVEEQLAIARAEERERCARAIEAERDRLFVHEGMTMGESCTFDICALVVRQLGAGSCN